MSFQDKGLTVGELTIAVSTLLIAGLVLSYFNKEDKATENYSSKSILVAAFSIEGSKTR